MTKLSLLLFSYFAFIANLYCHVQDLLRPSLALVAKKVINFFGHYFWNDRIVRDYFIGPPLLELSSYHFW